jgi:hypothetical protein
MSGIIVHLKKQSQFIETGTKWQRHIGTKSFNMINFSPKFKFIRVLFVDQLKKQSQFSGGHVNINNLIVIGYDNEGV